MVSCIKLDIQIIGTVKEVLRKDLCINGQLILIRMPKQFHRESIIFLQIVLNNLDYSFGIRKKKTSVLISGKNIRSKSWARQRFLNRAQKS